MVEFRFQRIKELREANGMTLEEMAGKMGKQKQQLGIWENGINSPTIDNLLVICNTFDVDPSFFFDVVSTLVEETDGSK
ncbi:MAG: helix-turn-helix transcriptional regulator [Deltaproteobacteria bacterium]|nr:helix-turn-helix transcriptional regulator [Deltaproteobacteria bacterium]